MPEARRAHRAREVRRLDLRAANGAALVDLGEPLLHRLDLELALARVLQILGRSEEHVDDRPEERREQADEGREADEPRVLDPPPRVLERPVRRREPEDDDEPDPEVAEKRPVGIVERELSERHGDRHSRSLPIP